MQIEEQKSKNHVGNVGKFEYFVRGKELFRALKTNPILSNSEYRHGARSQMPIRLIDAHYLYLLGLPIDALTKIKK